MTHPAVRDRPAPRVEEVVASVTAGVGPTLIESLERPRYEIVPLQGIDAALDHLPPEVTVTVTASPTKGLASTLELTRRLVDRGHPTVPHLAARLVRDRAHLREILDGLHHLGVTDAFVIAGDATEPVGPFEGAAELLEAMAELGHGLDGIGITGYPETHAFIPDQTTIDAMSRKAPHATYIVSQICYDPVTVRGWVRAVRARGVHLPIHIGLPGVVDRTRLLKLSLKVGLGDSIRFLTKQTGVTNRLLTGYQPDELVHGLGDLVGDPELRVEGWHLFTFNEIERTERWRREILDATRRASR